MRNGYKTKRRIKVKLNSSDEIPPSICGIYFLINKKTNVIEYIGQSTNVYLRLLGNYVFNRNKHNVRIIGIDGDKNNVCELLRWYERRFQQKYRPRLNGFIPRIQTNYLYNPY